MLIRTRGSEVIFSMSVTLSPETCGGPAGWRRTLRLQRSWIQALTCAFPVTVGCGGRLTTASSANKATAALRSRALNAARNAVTTEAGSDGAAVETAVEAVAPAGAASSTTSAHDA